MRHMNTIRACAILAAIAGSTANLNAAQVGDTVVWRNSGTAGTGISNANAADDTHTLSFCLPPMDGLPVGSTVKVTNISLGSRNTALGDRDPICVRIVLPSGGSNYYTSQQLNGTGGFSGETIAAFKTYDVPRLSYSFAGSVNLVVGATNTLETIGSGNRYITPGFKCVLTSDASSAIVLSSVSGSGWYPVYEITAQVVSLGSNPDTSATLAGDANLSNLSWSTALTGDGTQWGKIEVTDNATLTLDAATNFKLLTINVATNKTLTLTGGNALTATKIEISGQGTVAAATSSLRGEITGCGNVVYDAGAQPGATCGYNWCGTLSMANFAIAGLNFNNYGNVVSKLAVSGLSGWINTGTVYEPELILNDDCGFALKLRNGNSPNSLYPNRCAAFRKISGDGSIVDTIRTNGTWTAGGDMPCPVFKVYDASDFAGNLTLDRASMVICDPSTTYPDSLYAMFTAGGKTGVLRIDGSRSPTLASDKAWNINLYTNESDYNDLVVFEKSRNGLLDGGDLNIYVNGSPLDTSVYSVKEGRGSTKGHIIIRRIFGFRLRLR